MERNPEKLNFSSPEAEIAFLREQIANKEQQLRQNKVEYKIDDVVKDQINQYKDALPQDVLNETLALAKADVESIVLNLEPEQHDKKIEEILGIMNVKGIKNAMSVLAELKDPHLDDDFHRFLAQYIKKGYQPKDLNISEKEYRGLNMTLYEVVLPEEDGEGNQQKAKPLKELVSSMEQFLAGMMSVTAKDDTKNYKENYIVLEIANANGSDQFIFYVAVPNVHKALFEKQIISVFSNVKLTEASGDYNIFNPDGISVGSYMTTSNNAVYPFKTYEAFDHDPLNIVLNSFSKIQKEGEGAAIQILFAPKADYYNKKYNYAIEKIEKGTPTKDAIDLPESITGSVRKELFTLFKAPKKKEEGKEEKIDTEAIEKIKNKTSTPIVATNIRLVASAQSRMDAERILQTMESTFNQFTDATSSGLKAVRLDSRQLSKMFRNYSFRVFDDDQNLPLNLHEFATLIHFNSSSLSTTPQLKQVLSASAPAPMGMKEEGNYLGVNIYRNVETKVYLSDDDKLRHVYVIGQTGSGKSVFLKNQIIQDIQKGHGCCFMDPHGSDILDIMANIPPERYNDVIYFDPAYTERPMALNMLEYDFSKPDQKIFVVNELLAIFKKLFSSSPESMGPAFEQYFRNASMLVMEHPESGCTLVDISRVLSDKTYRDMKLSHCKNPLVTQFWANAEKTTGDQGIANFVPYITNKFDVFLSNDVMRPIISQEKSSFNFREIMDNKKILLVNLAKGKLGEMNANLIGLVLVGKLQMAALSRVDIVGSDFPPFYLYIDEFQNITTDSIASIFSEARKYKLSLTVAHQYIAQLEENIKNSVFGNVGNKIAFRVSSEDAEYLEKEYTPEFTAKDLMNPENLNGFAKVLLKGVPQKAFNLKEPYPPKGNKDIVEKLKQLSYLQFGEDRADVEAYIQSKFKK